MILRAQEISKNFMRKTKSSNVFTAVESMDFEQPEGTLYVVTGRSGSGKSTLMNMLAGLLEPSSGQVFAGEHNLYDMSDEELSKFRNETFGFIPQGQSAIGSLNVLENVLLPFSLYGESAGREEYAMELLKRFGIEELAEVMPSELSGGELRRMAIARALVRKPQIVFADEPTGDLDDENTEIVLECLKAITKDGTSVLLVTHENSALQYADKCFRMSGGVLCETGNEE